MCRISPEYLDANRADRCAAVDVLVREESDEEKDEDEDEDNTEEDNTEEDNTEEEDDYKEDHGGYSA